MERKQQGFTLLEIMLVVTIIALLLGAAIYNWGGMSNMRGIFGLRLIFKESILSSGFMKA
jgi:prepilin-type N-terminal cleavage/methylation domain